jgi:hypothetical protein
MTDKLQYVIEDIEQWTTKNDVTLVYSGFFDRKSMPNALWASTSHDWRGFLEAARRTSSELVWLEVEYCSLIGKDKLDELTSLADVDFKNEFLEQVAGLRKFEGQVASFYLYWAYRGVLNAFITDAQWLDEHYEYRDRLQEIQQTAQREIQFRERLRTEQKNRDEFERKANELLQHPKYQHCQNRNDRIYLAKEIFGTDINARKLVIQAETLDRMQS